MSIIPEEYLSIRSTEDFGFSAVDEAEVKTVVDENTLETSIIRETVSSSSEAVARLESKIDGLISLYEETKFGLESEKLALEGRKQTLEEEYVSKEQQANQVNQDKLNTLEKMIVPLLVNLMKNPEKEYIYWPDRKVKIEEQVRQILAITRGSTTA